MQTVVHAYYKFLSTLSVRRATEAGFRVSVHKLFLSTLSVRRATIYSANPVQPGNISIHALREESDAFILFIIILYQAFLSTLSVRRATPKA